MVCYPMGECRAWDLCQLGIFWTVDWYIRQKSIDSPNKKHVEMVIKVVRQTILVYDLV